MAEVHCRDESRSPVDEVALGAWAYSLFPSVRLPDNLRIAQEMGLGTIDLRLLAPVDVQST